jgi:hypothetical protein
MVARGRARVCMYMHVPPPIACTSCLPFLDCRAIHQKTTNGTRMQTHLIIKI